jgi:crotonobetainyl-CoA:carnitine CoA-transferase CaiB-like acyl-CoA transferase
VRELKPLEGIRVLDISHVVAGPFTAMMLADFGAEVIKIEKPGGEYSRGIGPFVKTGDAVASGAFLRMNRNKKGMTLNLKSEEGKKLFLELVKVSDVVIENFKAGTMDKLGLSYEKLKATNPRIIMASISGYGQPEEGNLYAQRPAFNIIAQAMGGLMEITGGENTLPYECGAPIGDLIPALMTCLGIVTSIRYRDITGKGQYIDISMYDVMTLMNERAINTLQMTGINPTRGKETVMAPHGAYRASNGYYVIDCYSNKEWQAICTVINRPELAEDERFNSGRNRAEHAKQIADLLEAWSLDKTKEEVSQQFVSAGVAASPVQTAEDLLHCEQLKHRHMIQKVTDPVHGDLYYPGNPIKFSDIEKPAFTPAPKLGEHTEMILSNLLGLPEDEIRDLKDSGAF